MPDQDVEQKRLDLDRERLNFEREQGQGQVALKNVEQDRKATTLSRLCAFSCCGRSAADDSNSPGARPLSG
jgi:hypothetical protein